VILLNVFAHKGWNQWGHLHHLPHKEIEISQNMFSLCFWALSMFDVTHGGGGSRWGIIKKKSKISQLYFLCISKVHEDFCEKASGKGVMF